MDLLSQLLFSDRAPKLLKKSLDFNAQKAAVTAANIANSETPGYKAVQVNFEKQLQAAVSARSLPMKITNAKHMEAQNSGLQSLRPTIEIDRSQGRLDGNNVNMEKEMITLTQTQLEYEAAISAMSKRGAMISAAIREAR